MTKQKRGPERGALSDPDVDRFRSQINVEHTAGRHSAQVQSAQAPDNGVSDGTTCIRKIIELKRHTAAFTAAGVLLGKESFRPTSAVARNQ